MKLNKKLIEIYETQRDSFKDFYELKCQLPGLINEGDIEVKEELYPKDVSSIFAIPLDFGIEMHIWFDTEFGSYSVVVSINFVTGYIKAVFDSHFFQDGHKKENDLDSQIKELTQKELSEIESKCLPFIESFLDTIDKLERNKPCDNDCYFRKLRKEKICRDKMYISEIGYTAEKDYYEQRIFLAREAMKKLNNNNQ